MIGKVEAKNMFFVGVPIRFIVRKDIITLAEYVIKLDSIKSYDGRTEKFDKVCDWVLEQAAKLNDLNVHDIKRSWILYDKAVWE